MSKDFKEAGAMQFISKPQKNRKIKKRGEFIETQKKVRETKSKALNLLVKPSIYTALKEESKNKEYQYK